MNHGSACPALESRPDVLVIGGGIIGAACACELARRGMRVTVVEKGRPGHGCSSGNAGWLSPSLATPLPMPGMVRKSLRWLLDSEAPLHIRPRLSWDLGRWLLGFLRSMNRAQALASVEALMSLARASLEAYRAMDAASPGAFSFRQCGLLLVARTPGGLEDAEHERRLASRQGIEGRVLSAAEVRDLEPAVTAPQVAGGVFFPEEAHVEPLAAVEALVRLAEQHGARFLPETEVFEFLRGPGRIEGVRTTRGLLRADHFVLATGSWSTRLAGLLGVRVPILAGKGYAVIVPPFEPRPKIPLMLVEQKVAVTPRADTIRLAGTLELVGPEDFSITSRRVDAIVRGSREYVNIPDPPRVLEVWRGLRPCTPDGVPMIGRAGRIENLWLACGHQMLGLLSAPATGRLLADLLLGEEPSFDPRPFRPERFA